MCGWTSDEKPWNLGKGYPGGLETFPPSPPSIPAEDLLVVATRRLNTNGAGCNNYPTFFWEAAFVGNDVENLDGGVRAGILLTFFTLVLEMVAMPFILRNLYRKLPGWMAAGGEEGAEKTNAEV